MTAHRLRTRPEESAEETRRPTTDRRSAVSERPADGTGSIDASPPDPEASEVLELLADEYVCDILLALEDGPKPARTLAEECGMSRPTAYRRLDRLTAVGLVRSRLALEPDGHHRQQFRLVLEDLSVQVGADGIEATLRVSDPDD